MRKIYFILILLPVFYSCKKSTSNDVLPDPRLYVYIAGAETNGSVNVAKYWENGQATILTDGTKDAWASSIAIAGGDIYVAGQESNGTNYILNTGKTVRLYHSQMVHPMQPQLPLRLQVVIYMYQGTKAMLPHTGKTTRRYHSLMAINLP